MRININMAFDAFLSHVGPRVSTHPLPFALWALVFTKAPFLALVWSQSFAFRPCLRAVFDIVSLVEAEMAQVVWWRSLAGFARLRGKREVREVVC